MVRRFEIVLLLILAIAPSASGRRRRATHENPHSEVTAAARVETAPRRTRHRNGREFEEFRVRLTSVDPAGAAPDFSFDTRGSIRVVHDLTCGGAWVELGPGQSVDLRGEYVHPPDGGDLIHFTHPADGSCGPRGTHPEGYLRRHGEAAPAGSGPGSPGSLAAFREGVRSVLSVRCAPCHEPGGKMYARLPFDDPATVSAHASRMATRLTGEDRKALLDWAAGFQSAAPR